MPFSSFLHIPDNQTLFLLGFWLLNANVYEFFMFEKSRENSAALSAFNARINKPEVTLSKR